MALARWFAKGVLKLAFAATLLGVLSLPSSAQGGSNGWELCNQTSFVIEAATGRPDGEDVIVEGWTRLRPGQCRTATQGPLKNGVYFVFARSSKAHRGGQRDWSGEIPLCVDTNGSFAVENPSSCASMGLEQRGFQAAFLGERKQPATTPMGELIDILEDVARKRSMQVGMMLCNRTGNRIIAAMARFRPDGLESRGWWTIEANLCVRTVDESLITAPHYVFAEMATPEGVRVLKGASTKFCTSRAQFAILGNENCEQRRYRSEKFVETAAPEEGKLVYEFFESAFGPAQRSQP